MSLSAVRITFHHITCFTTSAVADRFMSVVQVDKVCLSRHIYMAMAWL